MGESYNGIRALADLFAVIKIPNNVEGDRILALLLWR
jgi:hypothetical protein